MTVAAPQPPRETAVRRVRLYNNLTIGWNVVEGVVAIAAGVVAGSISLIGFGLDSGVEVSTSIVLAWRLAQERRGGCMTEHDRRATKAIALCFAMLAGYVAVEGTRHLAGGHAPDVSVPGIVIAAASVVVMPVLARAKKRLGPVLGSQAVVSESRQTELCAWLSGVVLVGLTANATLGWWWADPVAALGVAAFAGVEAVRTWRADSLADTCCG
jgi:divalent metal cation (Fe/Co/Zn/Cd) transporter